MGSEEKLTAEQQVKETSMSRLTTILSILGPLTMMPTFPSLADAGNNQDKIAIVNPDKLHDPSDHGYSVAVVAPAGARLAFVSGQGGVSANGTYSPDFSEQVQQAYANLKTVLDSLGASPDQVAKLSVFVVDHDPSKLGVLTENVRNMFGETLPAQTLIPVPKLAIDPMLFEVEAIVVLPQK